MMECRLAGLKSQCGKPRGSSSLPTGTNGMYVSLEDGSLRMREVVSSNLTIPTIVIDGPASA